jgi:hypothetical protein
MKKFGKFNQLSTAVCAHKECFKYIKLNVLMRKGAGVPIYCFKHYREIHAAKGHDMSTAREVRTGQRPGKKYRETIAETKKRLQGLTK